MQIAGFIKNSFIDFPGKISSVVFLQGCNLRCGYCHNPELIPRKSIKGELISQDSVLYYLNRNKGLVDGVVISGGEALFSSKVQDFLEKIKREGFLIKIDTNGCFPDILEKLINNNLVDFVAMDIKHIPELKPYEKVCGNSVNSHLIASINKSIDLLRKSNLPHQFRTTVIKDIHTPEDLLSICKKIGPYCSYCVQNFSPSVVLDDKFSSYKGFNNKEIKHIESLIKPFVQNIVIRT